jgi:probable phosphoglycerate mutase
VARTRILLARHGETEWNRVGRWQGHADPPLNQTGRRQAAELADRLGRDGISAVYSSDLARARETACAVARRLGLEVVEDRGLREIDVGSWSGLTRAEVEQRFPDGYASWLAGEIGHDGETREQLTARVVAAIATIAARHGPDDNVLVVTHGGVIRALRRHASGDPGEGIENCATVAFSFLDGTLVIPESSDV